MPFEDEVENLAYTVPDNGFGHCLYEPGYKLHCYHLLSICWSRSHGSDRQILQLRGQVFNEKAVSFRSGDFFVMDSLAKAL